MLATFLCVERTSERKQNEVGPVRPTAATPFPHHSRILTIQRTPTDLWHDWTLNIGQRRRAGEVRRCFAPPTGRTPLSWAVMNRHEAMVELSGGAGEGGR